MIDFGFGVSLGPISKADPEKLLAWRNDPEIYKWCRQRDPLERWTHEAWLSSLKDRSDVRMFAIVRDGDVLGVCGLTSIDLINRTAEFSLYVGTEWQGNGHGKPALRTLIAYAFKVLGLNHVFGESFDGNPAIKMFEEVGFTKDGTRRSYYWRNGKYLDAHLYSILASEFKVPSIKVAKTA